MPDQQPILILTALESELNAAAAPADVKVVYCGVGKVNAALHTTAAILAHRQKGAPQ